MTMWKMIVKNSGFQIFYKCQDEKAVVAENQVALELMKPVCVLLVMTVCPSMNACMNANSQL